MTLDFTAIDFETANGHASSACAVGLVKVRDGLVVDRAAWLIAPPEEHGAFEPFNIKIHGIQPEDVLDAPDWAGQLDRMLEFIETDIVVAHNAQFDMGVIRAASQVAFTPTPKLRYLCSVKIARKTYELDSYRLTKAAEAAGFREFHHHDALDDAEACAAIIIDSAFRHGTGDMAALAKATGQQIATLKAIPLKL